MAAFLAWIAFVDAMRSSQGALWAQATWICLAGGVALDSIWRGRAPARAAAALVLSLFSAYWALWLTYPGEPVTYLGILVLIASSGIVSDRGHVALTVAIMSGLALMGAVYPQMRIDGLILLRVELLIVLCAAFIVLSRRHLGTALTWSTESTRRAMQLNDALRDRQLLLNRTLRAMEEATYRIERMNNELILANHRAEEARVSKARFAATVSHEIRGPLNLILGFGRSMALSPERYGEDLTSAYYADADTIYRNAQHLGSLVDDVLDLSRVDAERLPLVKDHIDVRRDVAEKIIAEVRPLAEHKGLYLRLLVKDELPLVLADAVRLRQALLNLLTNAMRFTERGGITVTIGRDDDSALVQVSDTGPGIAPDRMGQLFKEFSQVHVDPSGEMGGSGLGLSIAKHLVEAHGGRIWAESRIDVGTAISFCVPFVAGDSATTPLISTAPVPYRVTPHKNCLVVHDDPAITKLLARYIEGYRVVGVTDAQQVAQLVERLHPRAIIANCSLVQAVERQLATMPYDVPIISCRLPSGRTRHRLAGILGYLIKPISPDTLLALLQMVPHDGEMTVLIADDEPDAVRLVERMLADTSRRFRILRANDGEQALTLMRQTRPDLVLLDWFMPRKNGDETIAAMRADAGLREVPVIIVSGRDWIESQATMSMPIAVTQRREMGIARAAKYMSAMLDEFSPDYVPGAAPVGSPSQTAVAQGAFAEPNAPPVPSPDAAA